MRSGDFGVEIVPVGPGEMRETERGHVLARPGQVYVIRLRNFGPLRCVARIALDGTSVTARGLVIDAYSVVDLERPVHESERGRFTVVAEGNEEVFGPDGGRDNEALGLVEARFRRELPPEPRRDRDPLGRIGFDPERPLPSVPELPQPGPSRPEPGIPPFRRPLAPPEWTPPIWNGPVAQAGGLAPARAMPSPLDSRAIERAAGTGLTGRSAQQFDEVVVGRLEEEATVIRLRIVIGAESAIAHDGPRPLPETATPARPAARP